ncbi:GIY-YIG nuclease family protein [Clavibacter zhangzhiyongii]|uniref:GIY-YIG nuclease family protein n=1 Tax=Clavibacter zhangzhiyongii TaxID=2768071 RepID=UPI0039A4A747
MDTWEDVRTALLAAPPQPPMSLGAELSTGIYAWWDLGAAVAPHYPADFPRVDATRPIYVGIAQRQSLAARGLKMHLKRTRVSGLRRSVAALLRDGLDLSSQVIPARGGMFGLAAAGEAALTDWMLRHLRVTWVAHPAPRGIEGPIVGAEVPPLNYIHATHGPYAAHMRALRADMHAAGSAQS